MRNRTVAIKISMGLQIACILLIALLSPASADQVLGTYNLLLDPGRISTWKTKWWSGQITPSQTNQGAKNVSMRFHINPSTTVSGGVFEVGFPPGFDLSVLASSGQAISVKGQVVQVAASVNAGVDTTISIPYVGLPQSAGPYGPFSLKTRALPTGQVIDMNLVFGQIYVTNPARQMETFAVTYSSTSSSVINSRGNTLSFKFTLKEDLWAHDSIRITLAPQFSLSNPICRSISYDSQLNTLNGTHASDPGKLECLVTSVSGAPRLWIYGLGHDFDVSADTNTALVNLEVTGFKNPDRDYPASTYVWTVDTIRFNTRDIKETGVCSGPETTHDWIYSAVWVPTWGRPVSYILKEQTIFMDTTFTIVNPIPDGGSIIIETSADSVAWGTNNNNRCYVVTLLSSTVTCSQSVGITIITGLTAQPAGTSVTFRTLSKFTTLYNAYREEIKSITTRSSEGYWIDRGENLAGFTLPPTSQAYNAALTILLEKADGTAAQLAGGTGDAQQYVKFMIDGMTYLTSDLTNYRIFPGDSSITLSCPMATEPNDHQFYFPKTNLVTEYKNSGTTFDFTSGTTAFVTSGYSTKSGSPLRMAIGSIAQDINGKTIFTPGTIAFTAGTDHQVNQFTIGFSVLKVSGLPQVINSGALVLPEVVSNAASVYECSLDIVDTTGTRTPIRATAQFNIDPQTFTSRGFTYFCSGGTLAGTPIRVSFLPQVLDLFPNTPTRTYYLDLVFSSSHYTTYIPGVSTFHDSGATEGEQYPMESSLSLSPTMIVTTDGQTSTFVHRITGLGNVAPQSASVDLYFPVGVAKVANPTLTFKTFYTLKADPRVRYQTHEDSLRASEQYTVDTSGASDGGAFTTQTIADATAVGGNSGTITMTLALSVKSTGDSYFYVIFPRGFSFQASRSVTTTSNISGTFSFVKYFSAPNLRFNFPGLLVKTFAAGLNIGGSSTTVQIKGVLYPIGAITNSVISVVHAHTGSLLTQACNSRYKKTDFSTIAGGITGVAVFPSSIVARGPEGIDVTHTISFTLGHGIDLGGWINIRINSVWGSYEYTDCVALGLDQAVLGVPVSCVVTGNRLVISGFAAFVGKNGATVSVRINHLAAPVITGLMEFFTDISTFPSWVTTATTSLAIDTYTPPAASSSRVTVTTALPVPVVNYDKISIFPNNAGVKDSDLYLKLRFAYRLPARTTINLTFPTQYVGSNPTNCTQVSDLCFSYSTRFRSCGCYLSSTNTKIGLSLVLDEELKANATLELFFDHAMDPPSSVYSPTSSTADGFRTQAAWFGADISNDGSSYRSQQLVVPDPQITGGITAAGSAPLVANPSTSYESSTYTFSFVLAQAFALTDYLYILFPDDYDRLIGDSEQWFATEVGNFYLNCVSQQLRSVYCRADHGIVVVQGSNALTAGAIVVLAISGVKNPKAGTTGNFRILHGNAAETILELAPSFGSVTITSLAANIIIKSATTTSRVLGSVSDYSLNFFMADTVLSTTELRLEFPKEFDLKMVDQKTNYPCSSTWIDHTLGSGLKGPQEWNEHRVCAAKNNTVTLPSPSEGISFDFNSEIKLTLRGVMTPQWGQERYPRKEDSDFDAWDWNVWTIWSFWTNQLKIFVYQKDSMRITSRAYSDLNAAYFGFMQPLRTISVNNYNPQNKANRVIVYPGTQTGDIPITLANSSMPLEAKTLQFHPITSKRTPDFNKLKYTSYQHNWMLLQDEWTLNFRVSADLSLAKGLYYINWKVDEARQPGVEHPVYDLPPVTLLEVAARTPGIVPVQIANILPIAVGTSGTPVKVSLSNPPHTDVTLNITLNSNLTTILISPRTLTFRPDLDFQYFNITVLLTHDYVLYPTQTLNFTLTGTDAEAYSVVQSQTFRLTEQFYKTYGAIATMGVGAVSRTSFTLAPVTDQPGIVYYAVSPKGSKIIPYSVMKAAYMTLEVSQLLWESRSLQHSNDRLQGAADVQPPPGTSWNDFRHQLFREHMSSYLTTGALVLTTADANFPVLISGLWAGSDYQVVGYFDNMNPNSPGSDVRVEYITTNSVADCAGVSVTFAGLVGQNQQTRVQQVLAKTLGVNPARLQSPAYLNVTSRDLQTGGALGNSTTGTEFQYYLVASRALDAPTPAELSALTPQQVNDLTTDMKDSLGLELISYGLLAARQRINPLWVQRAEVKWVNNASITVNYQSNADGQACCVALHDAENAISSDQVVEGYNYNWTKVPSQCSPVKAFTTGLLDIEEVKEDEVYFVFCVLTDDYPLWGTQMEYSAVMEMPFIPVHTPMTVMVEVEKYELGAVLALGLLWAF